MGCDGCEEGCEEGCGDDPVGDDVPGVEVCGVEAARALLRGAALVVGLHPDQATEHIVDYCLANDTPFAVVPCCVYRKQFPGRRHPGSGRPVSDYADLVEYLLSKSPAVRAVELDFEGKNVLLYHLGQCTPLCDPGSVRSHYFTLLHFFVTFVASC